MKRIKNKDKHFDTRFLVFFLLYFAGFCTAWTYTYDTATPVGSDSPSVIDDRIREVKAAVQERANVDHYWPLTGTQVSDAAAGQHRQVEFYGPISTPTNATDKGWIYTKDVSSVVELHWEDESGNELQLTTAGKLLLDSIEPIPNNTYFTADNAAGDGTVDLIKANASDVAVIPDGSELATSGAPTADADIANKKYVDDSSGTGTGYYDADGTVVFNTNLTAANTFQDLDLSSYVGSNVALCFFQVSHTETTDVDYAMKPKGEGTATFARHMAEDPGNSMGGLVARFHAPATEYAYMTCATDSSGVIQHGASINTETINIKLIGYVK